MFGAQPERHTVAKMYMVAIATVSLASHEMIAERVTGEFQSPS